MLKNISKLEFIIENRVYHLLCDSDSPLNHVKEALFNFMKFVGNVEDSAKVKNDQENVVQSNEKEESPIQVVEDVEKPLETPQE